MNWNDVYQASSNEFLWKGPGMPLVREFISRIQKQGADRILDAACGDGRHLVMMAHAAFSVIVGCDGSSSALELCQKRLRAEAAHTLGSVRLVQSPLDDLPFSSGSFDAIVCVDALVHNSFEVSAKIIRELSRCVRNGGQILFNQCTDNEPTRELPGMTFETPCTAFYSADPQTPQCRYEFYDQRRLNEFFEEAKLNPGHTQIRKQRWKDEPHPRFRDYVHEHEAWFVEVAIP